jgi:hypothetical protein
MIFFPENNEISKAVPSQKLFKKGTNKKLWFIFGFTLREK